MLEIAITAIIIIVIISVALPVIANLKDKFKK